MMPTIDTTDTTTPKACDAGGIKYDGVVNDLVWRGEYRYPTPVVTAELLEHGMVRIGAMRYTWNGVRWEVVL